MSGTLSLMKERYAELLVRTGLNLQPGQSLVISAELEHAPLVRLVAAAAYRGGARYVDTVWRDTPTSRARLANAQAETLSFYPDYEVARYRQMVDEGWARLALVGAEFPNIFDDVDPQSMRTEVVARRQKTRFYSEAMMANKMQWCVAGAPTQAWALQVFPDQKPADALGQLWQMVLRTCRVDQPDPDAAWQEHHAALTGVTAFLAREQVRAVRFVDAAPGPDGKPASDLTVGLTDRPRWIAAGSTTPAGVPFFANMPTEEVFTTPHSRRTEGYVRISRPAVPFDRLVENAWFRFEGGEVVGFGAETGQDVLEQFFAINGTRRLGEVSLVDVRSPIHQAGVIFHEILFDENAACHIAFGEAYPAGMEGAEELSGDEQAAAGVNKSDMHEDMMIGTATMDVTGLTADGREVAVMRQGQFVPEALE